MTTQLDTVERMFRVLVRTIRTKHPAYLAEAFTLADLQQQILPYRHFRRDLGLESNQEYELALMQLVGGAKQYLKADERVRDEFSRELASSDPKPARIRDFGDARLWLDEDAAAAIGTAGTPVSSPVQPPIAEKDREERLPSSARCRFCGGELPKVGGREINFCPHCGQNLRVRHCPACGAETEEGWKYCVSCGKGLS